ncbi:MAG: peptide-methionine (S)-S-oxide reductase, partial [Actinomycetota bacterium]|nr:peptide-methionine (S)-S-oxide reductase [Actinomycetota bacterium]
AQVRFRRPIVTEVVPAGEFWPAEDYHQQYLEKRGLASCHWAPKA